MFAASSMNVSPVLGATRATPARPAAAPGSGPPRPFGVSRACPRRCPRRSGTSRVPVGECRVPRT
jgi:hypothetical protein